MSERRIIRPDGKLLVKYYLYLLLVILFFVLPGELFGLIPDIGWVFVFIYSVANLAWILPIVVLIPFYYRTIAYEIGDEDIVVRRGIITKSETTVPYRTVTNIDVKEGPLDRLLGIGSLKIHTAGYSQQTSAEATLSGVREFESLHTELRAALRRYRARSGEATAADELPEPAGTSEALLGEILSELRALRHELADRKAS